MSFFFVVQRKGRKIAVWSISEMKDRQLGEENFREKKKSTKQCMSTKQMVAIYGVRRTKNKPFIVFVTFTTIVDPSHGKSFELPVSCSYQQHLEMIKLTHEKYQCTQSSSSSSSTSFPVYIVQCHWKSSSKYENFICNDF